MKRLNVVLGLGLSLTTLVANGQTSLPSDATSEVEKRYEIFNSMSPTDLHASAVTFPDGVRGRELRFPSENNVGVSRGRFSTDLDARINSEYCASSAIVLAKNTGNTGVLSKNKHFIYTVSQFQVLDRIKQPTSGLPENITVSRLGGDVVDQGERLRIAVENQKKFATGKTYLLYLYSTTSDGVNFRAVDAETIAVDGDRFAVGKIPNRDSLTIPRYSELKAKYQSLLATQTCLNK